MQPSPLTGLLTIPHLSPPAPGGGVSKLSSHNASTLLNNPQMFGKSPLPVRTAASRAGEAVGTGPRPAGHTAPGGWAQLDTRDPPRLGICPEDTPPTARKTSPECRDAGDARKAGAERGGRVNTHAGSHSRARRGQPRGAEGPSGGLQFRAWLWQPTPGLLPAELQAQGSLAGYSPWDRRESDTTVHSPSLFSL